MLVCGRCTDDTLWGNIVSDCNPDLGHYIRQYSGVAGGFLVIGDSSRAFWIGVGSSVFGATAAVCQKVLQG